ncbi:acyl-CoA dehydrogenase family protein [Dactylosporangium sp. NPDC000244]|uniref:acyl-CoA dehydrogenase family protein n=1 Tax=Dactylosporangium sp. NPDC000244 TaxID=3154365 RepID=UPI00333397E9
MTENALTHLPGLAALATKLRGDADRAQALPAELVAELTAAGCFRMVTPVSHGGDELPLPDVIRVVAALSRADAAVGWTVGQAALAQVVFAYLPPPTFDTLYADGPDVVGAGATAPKGRAMRDPEGGWRISGQWPFVTGCGHARWFFGQCAVVGDDPAATGGADGAGPPPMRLAVLPMDSVTVVDSWHVLGLRGTGSNDVKVRRRSCPDEWTCSVVGSRPALDRPGFRTPLLEYGAFLVAAAMVGIAWGAVDDVVALAGAGKRPAFSPAALADQPLFQDRAGEAYLAATSAEALLTAQTEAAWARAARPGSPASLVERAALRGTAAEVATLARRAVDTAYQLGGGSSIYDSCGLQQRMRDLHTATQHAVASRQPYQVLGSALVDRPNRSLAY